jgi:hypothetical protein
MRSQRGTRLKSESLDEEEGERRDGLDEKPKEDGEIEETSIRVWSESWIKKKPTVRDQNQSRTHQGPTSKDFRIQDCYNRNVKVRHVTNIRLGS